MGRPGDNGAPTPATTSTLPVVVVILKNESITVVVLVVMLVGGDSIVDFGNRAHKERGVGIVGGRLVVGINGWHCFPFEQQSS